uniref:dAMP1 SANT/Myb-like domain-containing protein n=1 Tax=Panagrolaimus sp. JU765 TaxID=591449 RepID=A0AC34RQQ9_9BILA
VGKKGKKSAAALAKDLLPDSMGINVDGIVSQIPDTPILDHLLMSRKKFGKKPVRKWNSVGFTNPARGDELKLVHYRRIDNKEDTYPFAAFNKLPPVPEYSDDLYDIAFKDEDWSKEETKYLMEMASKYWLLWPVMADRYDFQGKKRTVLELKQRFYLIDDFVKAFKNEQPSGFDYNSEKLRREQLENYLSTTFDEVEEEDKALKEYDRLKRRENELLARKKIIDFQEYAKKYKPGSLSMLSASRIRHRNSTFSKHLASPTSPLKSPTGKANLSNVKEIIDYGLTAKAVQNMTDFQVGVQSASDVASMGPTHKLSLYNDVYRFYEVKALCPTTIYSYENVQNLYRIRRNIHCIGEQKASLLLLFMELENILQQFRALGVQKHPLPEHCTIEHFMRQRQSSTNSRIMLASLFSILPAIFPPENIVDYSSGQPRRRKNVALPCPERIEAPEGLVAKQECTPSPVRVPNVRKRRNERELLLQMPSSTPTIDPGTVLASRQFKKVSIPSSPLSPPVGTPIGPIPRRRKSNASTFSELQPLSTRHGRMVVRKSWAD